MYLSQIRGFETLFGYDVPSMNTLLSPANSLVFTELQRRIMTDLRTTGSWDGDLWRCLIKKANWVYVSLRANVIFNEKNDGIICGVITNITDRIRR